MVILTLLSTHERRPAPSTLHGNARQKHADKCVKDLVGMDLHVPEDTEIIDWDAALNQVRPVDYVYMYVYSSWM